MDAMTTKPDSETGGNGTRLQIEFSRAAMEVLTQIKARSGAASHGEVVRDALRLYGWFLEQQAQGARIQIAIADGTVKEIEFAF